MHMSARTIRRAAERKALKLAAKAAAQSQTTSSTASHIAANEEQPLAAEQPIAATAAAGATFGFSTEPEPQPQKNQPISDARLNANRANAKLSTGPTSAEGRAKSSMNAIKTGLTGRTVLLPSEDALAYQQHHDRHIQQFAPRTAEEKSLVQSIADSDWRLLKIVPLEASIWAVARIKLAGLYPEISDPAQRQSLIDGEIQLAYRKDLSNLALQERRLRNQCATDTARLETLRSADRQRRDREFLQVMPLFKAARQKNLPFDPAFFGFVFSIADLEREISRQHAIRFLNGTSSELSQEQFEILMTSKAA